MNQKKPIRIESMQRSEPYTSRSFRILPVSIVLVVAWSSVLIRGASAQESSQPATSHTGPHDPLLRTRVVLLGTGTPNADPAHSGPATAVVIDDTPYIIDAGPGVVRRAAAAHNQGVDALRPENLATLFFTHLHSDHTTGYADFILTPWILERDRPLQVYGPPGTKTMTDHLLAAYAEDIRVRLEGLEPANDTGHRVEVTEIDTGTVYTDERVTVKAFRVHHGNWEWAFGFRFEGPDRTVVISGDRAPDSPIDAFCRDCDVLVHEVYSVEGFKKRPEVWQTYHADSHTSSVEVGHLARRVKPGLLVLTHHLLWGSTPEKLLEEVRSVYDGPVVFGEDLDVY